MACTDDREVEGVPYQRERAGRHRAAALQIPTLAEELRRGGGRVVTMALKARSAIALETLSAWLATEDSEPSTNTRKPAVSPASKRRE